MAASESDYFQKVGRSTATTLSAPGYTIGDTSITVGSTTNWATTTGVTFAIDTIDSAGERVDGSYNVFRGTVASATSITNVTYVGGDANQNYSAGSTTRVYILLSSYRDNRMVDGLLVEHKQTGAHSDITADSITNAGALTQTGALTLRSWDGWWDANETWTYASGSGTNVGTFTIAGVDRTTKYQAGDRIKFTQTTVKYALITKVAYASDTTITIYLGTDYTIANAAISSNYFSHIKAPFGFPLAPEKWTVTTTSSNDRTNFGSGTWASLTDSITVPIGSWRLTLKAQIGINTTQQASRNAKITLSSDASTETNTNTTAAINQLAASSTSASSETSVYRVDDITLTSSTTFTLMGRLSSTTNAQAAVYGSSMSPIVIKAISNYL